MGYYTTKPFSAAFPYLDIEGEPRKGNLSVAEVGLTKREYFAAIALQGLLATYDADIDFADIQEQIAGNAVDLADALIQRLNQQDDEAIAQ